MVPMPVNPYGLQKLSFELFMRLFSDLYNLNSVALRLFNVYGPGCAGDSPYATAIAAWCDKLSKNEPLRSDGDGEQTRDMIYVEDVVEAFVRFATDYDEKGFAAVNVGTGGSISNNDILRKLQLKNLDFRIQNSPERPGDSKYTRAAINKLRKCLRWEPTTQFDEGLEKTLKWWKMI
jgi:UDP-glucose 4-epimerase